MLARQETVFKKRLSLKQGKKRSGKKANKGGKKKRISGTFGAKGLFR